MTRNRCRRFAVENLESRRLLSAHLVGYMSDGEEPQMIGTNNGGVWSGPMDWTAITQLNTVSFKPEDFSGSTSPFVKPTTTSSDHPVS